jgi:uncharacterized protein (TIGR03083 family)
MAASPWPTIHAERQALADDLTGLTDAQWQSPACGEWSVHETLAHMTATAKLTPPGFFGAMIGSGFRFGAMANKLVARESAGGPAATLAEFRRLVPATSHPPGPVDSWLGETIVHGEDIRRAVGVGHIYPTEAVVRLLDFYKGSNLLIGSKKRIAGLTLRATDADWTHGSGPEVRGPAIALLRSMTGRSSGLVDLSGDGVEALRAQM